MNFFVLLSTFRNFGFAEVTDTLKCKRKMAFPFAFLSFFRNFVRFRILSLSKGCLED